MERIEFYQFNQELWYKDDNGNHRLEEGTEVVDKLFAFLCEFYPDAISALQKEYRKIEEDKYRMFRIVSRFCKCNFGVADNIYDIGSDKKVNFEYEIIIDDDCSPDDSREIIKEYAQNPGIA